MTVTLKRLADDLQTGRATARSLLEDCLQQIAEPGGEGQQVFISVDADGARAAADAVDASRRAGTEPSAFAGIPVSIKDLFDVRGQVTRAGSRVLDGPPARRDAAAVGRWRRAGLVAIGRSNMTEFAYSGVGLNPHFGTPANPWDRARRRIPGGSSSGAAVSLTDAMAHGALGTDTGGSCRIPAALCGVVGYKPTQARVPRDGMIPLSPSLDAVGVLGRSVACCAVLEALLRDAGPTAPTPPRRRPRLAVPRNYLFDDVDATVANAFDRVRARLTDAGAEVEEIVLPGLDAISEMNAGGGFPAAESYAWHQDLIAAHAAAYDPRVLGRIRRGADQTDRDLLVLRERRAALIADALLRLARFDAFICPTVPQLAPPIAELEAGEDVYTRANLLMLRNPTVVNLLDGCAVSVPMHREGEPPSGLMIAGLAGADDAVVSTAAWIEELI